ncbi:MAG: two-component system response regulator TorR [Spiribacter salinus]|uniref:Two-component system response regulator TorR n=1 Tax=Spiribacter salinus TaxID=1335746 RepID=A0A540VSM9_9GAMM|nr:MAG: two-component system response regulator TorR [Spiribacter salinus]
MTAPYHVVVVEDDPVARTKLAGCFTEAGYRVSEAGTAEGVRTITAREGADLFLIDINLPGDDGFDLTRELRERRDVAIILVSGRTEEIDRVVGLELGADDYVTKPFSARELLARAKNVLRRVKTEVAGQADTVRFDRWTFDLVRRTLTDDAGNGAPLTRSEYQLLAAFVRNPGEVLDRDRLMQTVKHRKWDTSDRTIDVLVRRLRQKLESDPHDPTIIVTAHGEGYVFVAHVTNGY